MKGIHFVQIHRAKSTFHHRGIVWNERSSIHRFSHSSPLKKKKKETRFLVVVEAIRYLALRQKRSRSARFLISFQLENHESHGRSKVPSDGETLRLFNLSSEFPFIPYPLPSSFIPFPLTPAAYSSFLFSFSASPLLHSSPFFLLPSLFIRFLVRYTQHFIARFTSIRKSG